MATNQPKTVQSEYQRACEIAKADGIAVRAVTVEGVTIYVTVRPTNLSIHIVRCEGGRLVCDKHCTRSNMGHYCAHKAATRLFLLAEREAEKAHLRAAPAPIPAKPATYDNPKPAARPAFRIWASDHR